MAFQPLAILSSLVSGLFGGMASRAIRERNYANAKWLSQVSVRLALHPYTKMSAMAVLANAELLGKKFVEARNVVARALAIYHASPELAESKEVVALANELERLQGQLE
jgi:hypothetical protein